MVRNCSTTVVSRKVVELFADGCVNIVDPDGTSGAEFRHGAVDRCHAAGPAVRLDSSRRLLPQEHAAVGARAGCRR